MGVADLRDAFNAVAQPQYTATQAFQAYLHEHDAELQVLQFVGTDAQGKPFKCQSDKLRPHSDLIAEARKAAQDFIAKQKATT